MYRKVILLVLTLPFILISETFWHEKGGIEISFPDNYKKEYTMDVLSLSSPDSSLNLVFIILDSSEMEEAASVTGQIVRDELGEVNMGTETSVIVNGMNAWIWDTSTKDDLVQASVMLLQTPYDQIMMIFGVAATEFVSKNEKDLLYILSSIKPIED